jgi:hypothetical protein
MEIYTTLKADLSYSGLLSKMQASPGDGVVLRDENNAECYSVAYHVVISAFQMDRLRS